MVINKDFIINLHYQKNSKIIECIFEENNKQIKKLNEKIKFTAIYTIKNKSDKLTFYEIRFRIQFNDNYLPYFDYFIKNIFEENEKQDFHSSNFAIFDTILNSCKRFYLKKEELIKKYFQHNLLNKTQQEKMWEYIEKYPEKFV
jgi:hypothetical protein